MSTQPESETPRTDAAQTSAVYVFASFARALERELSTLTANLSNERTVSDLLAGAIQGEYPPEKAIQRYNDSLDPHSAPITGKVFARIEELTAALAQRDAEIAELNASLPLVSNRTENESMALLDKVQRHDDGNGASHGCIESGSARRAVVRLIADRDYLRARLTALEAECGELRDVAFSAAKAWSDQSGRFWEAMGDENPRLQLVDDAMQALMVALGKKDAALKGKGK